MRVPWTARRSTQSILKETSPGCSLEGLMLKLKLQYSGHLMRRTDSLEKLLMLGKTEGRRRGRQRMRRLDSITNSMDLSLSKLQEMVKDKGSLACCNPWSLENQILDILILDCQPPDQCENKFLLFKSHSLWHFLWKS